MFYLLTILQLLIFCENIANYYYNVSYFFKSYKINNRILHNLVAYLNHKSLIHWLFNNFPRLFNLTTKRCLRNLPWFSKIIPLFLNLVQTYNNPFHNFLAFRIDTQLKINRQIPTAIFYCQIWEIWSPTIQSILSNSLKNRALHNSLICHLCNLYTFIEHRLLYFIAFCTFDLTFRNDISNKLFFIHGDHIIQSIH